MTLIERLTNAGLLTPDTVPVPPAIHDRSTPTSVRLDASAFLRAGVRNLLVQDLTIATQTYSTATLIHMILTSLARIGSTVARRQRLNEAEAVELDFWSQAVMVVRHHLEAA